MTLRLSTALAWYAVAALAVAILPLLVRNLLAIPAHVPLDPNEGWNAAHALAALAGHRLYPPPQALMINNYPPLSFYLVGAIAGRGGDAILAGRTMSLVAFLLTCAGIAACLNVMKCHPRNIALGTSFFAAVLLIDSDYVGMYDPQLLGHAVQLAALLMLLRQRQLLAALLFAASLFIKHNLLALPLASTLWLVIQDRRAGLQFLLWELAFTLAGLVVFQLVFGASLLAQLASPRLFSPVNLSVAITNLWWAPLPLAAMAGLWPDRSSLFCTLYTGAAAILGLIFAAGDGVDINAFFDLAIALSLALGLAGDRGRWAVLSAASVLPLVIFLAVNIRDNNFFYSRDFAKQSANDIDFLKSRSGPVLCDQLSLCLWAGKGAQVDVFNVGEGIKSGARDPSSLARMISNRQFAALQLDDLNEMGPTVRQAILKHYRLHHADDNGKFLVP